MRGIKGQIIIVSSLLTFIVVVGVLLIFVHVLCLNFNSCMVPIQFSFVDSKCEYVQSARSLSSHFLKNAVCKAAFNNYMKQNVGSVR